MSSRGLGYKMRVTFAGFGVLSCFYFVIAVWLKSDGVNFNPLLVYELLKDTLTIGAAFLAPVTAFALFSDWREQHREKEQEVIASEICNSIDRLKLKIWSDADEFMSKCDRDLYFYKVFEGKFAGIEDLYRELLVLSTNFVATSEDANNFHTLANTIIQKKIPAFISAFEFQVDYQKMKDFPKESGINLDSSITEEVLETYRSYPVVFEESFGKKYWDIYFLLEELRGLRSMVLI